ncbi:MAG: hypothetical protein LH473_13365, partial [Chitinophagales bacterium]|nr:hypothetical protein [Chitinophagales bacterium]
MNNNLGACISKGNFVITDTLSEKMDAVKHANGRDWWIVVHDRDNDKFVKFLATPDSIQGPFYQSIGSDYSILFIGAQNIGQMRFSRDGSKLAVVGLNNLIETFDFDRCSGDLSSPKIISYQSLFVTSKDALYGCSFSPSGRFLYVSSFRQLFQFDLLDDDPSITVDTLFIMPSDSFLIGGHQLFLDDKIYIANGTSILPSDGRDTINMNLNVITQPEYEGATCQFKPYSFYLGGHRSVLGLPNLPNYGLGVL